MQYEQRGKYRHYTSAPGKTFEWYEPGTRQFGVRAMSDKEVADAYHKALIGRHGATCLMLVKEIERRGGALALELVYKPRMTEAIDKSFKEYVNMMLSDRAGQITIGGKVVGFIKSLKINFNKGVDNQAS